MVSWVVLHGMDTKNPSAHWLHALQSRSRSPSGPHVLTAKLTPVVHTLHRLHAVSWVALQPCDSYSFSAHIVQFAHTAACVALHGCSWYCSPYSQGLHSWQLIVCSIIAAKMSTCTRITGIM